VTRYIDQHKDRFGVEPICRTLEIAPSTYYAARSRPPSVRQQRDEELKPKVERVHAGNYSVYGAEKVWRQLRREGVAVGRDRTARLMSELGLAGITRSARTRTAVPAATASRPEDLVGRNFSAPAPEPAVGGGPDLRLDLGGVLLRGLCGRRLQPPDRGLASVHLAPRGARARRARDGDLGAGLGRRRARGRFTGGAAAAGRVRGGGPAPSSWLGRGPGPATGRWRGRRWRGRPAGWRPRSWPCRR
jgi:hypothetical protein